MKKYWQDTGQEMTDKNWFTSSPLLKYQHGFVCSYCLTKLHVMRPKTIIKYN